MRFTLFMVFYERWLFFAEAKCYATMVTRTKVAHLVGIFVERWLFFAEAKHVVSTYYTDNRDETRVHCLYPS